MLFIVFGTFFHTAETFVNKAESSLGLYPTRRSLQFSLVAQLCLTLPTPQSAARQASLSITNSWSLLKLMSVDLVMPSNHLILCPPLLFLPSVLLIPVSSSHQMAKVLEFQLQDQSFQ